MWPAILGMTYAALPESKAGLAGGLILGAAGIGNAIGPLLGGAADRRAELALDLLRQPPDRRVRRARRRWSKMHQTERRAEDERRIDYAGIATLSVGARRAAGRAGPGDRLGLGRPAHHRPARALRRAARVLRASSSGAWASSALVPRDVIAQPQVRVAVPGRAADVGRSSSPRCSTCRSSCRRSSATRRWRRALGLLPMMGTFAATSFVAGPLYNGSGAKLIVSLGAALHRRRRRSCSR